MPELTLALPAYNEAQNIAAVLDQSVAALEQFGRSWEILVIDNHSSDRTAERVEAYGREQPGVRLTVHEENRLYSGSCATALREAKGQIVAIMDSDGQMVATDLPKLIEKIEGGANLVFGWRRQRHDKLARKVISSLFNRLGKLWLSTPLHDLNCGMRAFDRKFLAAAEIKYRINMANPELYVRAKLAGLKVDEVEVEHFHRKHGATSHNFLKSLQIFYEANRYFYALRKELKQAKELGQPHDVQ